ncbi:hypothetical protein, partial [Legionella pneumophila]|uniref:hypothetical protein n=1 Tax=Legionella pneumophila TaxID=446 RepID=UPI001F46773B
QNGFSLYTTTPFLDFLLSLINFSFTADVLVVFFSSNVSHFPIICKFSLYFLQFTCRKLAVQLSQTCSCDLYLACIIAISLLNSSVGLIFKQIRKGLRYRSEI